MRTFKDENRLMYMIRRLWFPVAAMLFLTLFDLTAASAARLRCASHGLTSAERDQVFDRAPHIAPRNVGSLTLESACWNPDFAIAWLRTPTMVGPDGVYSWWAVRCDRKASSWSCDPATLERRVKVSIADHAQHFAVVGSFPDGMSTSRAKAIIAAAATLAMRLKMPLPPCARDGAAASRWHWMHGNPPVPDMEYPAAEVNFVSTGATVDYQPSLRFHFDKDNQAVCWDALVVVD